MRVPLPGSCSRPKTGRDLRAHRRAARVGQLTLGPIGRELEERFAARPAPGTRWRSAPARARSRSSLRASGSRAARWSCRRTRSSPRPRRPCTPAPRCASPTANPTRWRSTPTAGANAHARDGRPSSWCTSAVSCRPTSRELARAVPTQRGVRLVEDAAHAARSGARRADGGHVRRRRLVLASIRRR